MPPPRRARAGARHDPHQPRLFETIIPPPFGVIDLNPTIVSDLGPPPRIKCFVSGCDHMVRPPTRKYRGEVCPVHHIRCHQSGTYSYPDVRRNTVVAHDLLATRIVGHEAKFESHRLGSEKAEDTLSFTVFRSFQEARMLNYLARFITGRAEEEEPHLFLWGIEMNDTLRTWDLLTAARNRFERKLPVKRPLTEPDIALYLPTRYVLLIEAKFTSPNTAYQDGERKDAQSLTKNELLTIYSDRHLRMLDRKIANAAERVYYQLWRNVTFSEWMARAAGDGSTPYFCNLTRRGYENDSFDEFRTMVRPEFAGRVSHVYWEDLFTLAGLGGGRLSDLQQYLLNKTANLIPAFDFAIC